MNTFDFAPPGVSSHLNRDEHPSVNRVLKDETTGRDDIIDPKFFRQMEDKPIVTHTWDGWHYPDNVFPMVYSDMSLISAAFTLPYEEAQGLLPEGSRLTPVKVLPGKAVMLVFGFDYRRGGLGAYHELGVAIPVMFDHAGHAPVLHMAKDLLFPGRDPNMGMYAVELPVDQERACVAGIKLYGLPKMVGSADFSLSATLGATGMSFEGKRLAYLSVELPKPVKPKRYDLSFNTYSVSEGRIIRTRYETIGVGYKGMKGSASFLPGDHPRFAKFHGLSLSKKPVEVRLMPRLNWIIWGPEDVGAAY